MTGMGLSFSLESLTILIHMGVEEEFICARENRFLTTEPKFVHLKSPSVNFMTHFTDFIPMLFIKLNCSRSECWVLTLHACLCPLHLLTPSVPTCNIHNSAHFSKTIQTRGSNPMF